MPHVNCLCLANDCCDDPLPKKWARNDCSDGESNDIKILLLGSLHYLGRGNAFDDIEETTCASRESSRKFFNDFIEYGCTTLNDGHAASLVMSTDAPGFEELFSITRVMLNFCAHYKKLA